MKLFYLFLLVKLALFDEFDDFVNNSPLMQDALKCSDSENKDQCLSITLSNNDYQCCMMEIEYEPDEEEDDYKEDSNDPICSILTGSIELLKNLFDDNIFKETMKELFGYLRYGLYIYQGEGKKYYPLKNFAFNQTYECKDGKSKFSYGYEKYTQNELNILKSDYHCLRYFYRYNLLDYYEYDEKKDEYYLKPVSKDECLNADYLQSSKDAGISCGYYEFKINYLGGTSETLTTCYLVSPNFYKNGEFDSQTKNQIESFINYYTSQNEKISQNYVAQFTDSEGNTYVYDSSTGKIETSNSNGSSFISLNFIILFIFLFL